jgi:hypothetical protein
MSRREWHGVGVATPQVQARSVAGLELHVLRTTGGRPVAADGHSVGDAPAGGARTGCDPRSTPRILQRPPPPPAPTFHFPLVPAFVCRCLR